MPQLCGVDGMLFLCEKGKQMRELKEFYVIRMWTSLIIRLLLISVVVTLNKIYHFSLNVNKP